MSAAHRMNARNQIVAAALGALVLGVVLTLGWLQLRHAPREDLSGETREIEPCTSYGAPARGVRTCETLGTEYKCIEGDDCLARYGVSRP